MKRGATDFTDKNIKNMKYKTVAIIPARFASTRLHGKLIKHEAKEQTGKYLIEHVYNKVKNASCLREVYIACDDERIFKIVNEFGGCAKMTSTSHKSGTDRIAEVASNLDADFIINIQGDEPDIRAEMIEELVKTMYAEKDAVVCTLANEIRSMEELRDPNAVKVVLDRDYYAMYFSRAPIPFIRDSTGNPEFNLPESIVYEKYNTNNKTTTTKITSFPFLKHLGIYMYRKDFLLAFSSLPMPLVEDIEKLEQLRILSNGYKIKVVITPYKCEGVDTPEDFEHFLNRYRIEKE